MKKIAVLFFLIIIAVLIFFGWNLQKGKNIITPFSEKIIEIKERPLDKYTYENLSKTKLGGSQIGLGKLLKESDDFASYIFYFYVEGKKVSGLTNIPKKEGIYAAVVMFRGYVDREKYTSGVGTQRAGEVFATNGFITLAPDFLGYGESDNPSDNAIEERFQTYVTALTLIASIKNLNQAFVEVNSPVRVDSEKIGIWGHSNGGQIALSILEIGGESYPTVFWAPVSKPFPYSILYYTDEFDDRGKTLRGLVADFEKEYDVELYSLTNFFDKINAPLQLHQGSKDESVPVKWSNQLFDKLKELKKDIVYFTYQDEDHNFSKGSWPLAVSRSIAFYQNTLKNQPQKF